MFETTIYVAALVTISITCLGAVLSHKFDDNLLQRIGLAMACMGATVRLLDLVNLVDANSNARYLLTYGVSVFCIGTAYKFWRKS